jgi:hypothetical protein
MAAIGTVYGGREQLNLSDLPHIVSFVVVTSLAGLIIAVASWYLGMHKRFPPK